MNIINIRKPQLLSAFIDSNLGETAFVACLESLNFVLQLAYLSATPFFEQENHFLLSWGRVS